MINIPNNTHGLNSNQSLSQNNIEDTIQKIQNETSTLLDNNTKEIFVIEESKKKLLDNLKKGFHKEEISSILYDFLTKKPSFTLEMAKENNPNYLFDLSNVLKPQLDYYRNVLEKIEDRIKKDGIVTVADNPGWFSLKTKNYSNNDGPNLKRYITIPNKGYSFVSYIYQLAKRLEVLARETNDKISLKVPKGLLGFLTHNDSIVIHFKNPDNNEKIKQILESWKKENSIEEAVRSFGRTKFAIDRNNSSFSQLIADNIVNWVLENYGKYDDEILANLAIKYAIEQSQKVPNIISNS